MDDGLVFLFGLSLGVLYNSEPIFGPNKVSVIGMSSCILILTNLVSWPNIMEKIRDERTMAQIKSERGRAEAFVYQLDSIIGFCSGLMQQVNDIHEEYKVPSGEANK